MARWTPTLIPKKTFQGRRTTQTLGPRNRPTKSTVNFDVEEASYHPVTGRDALILGDGYRDKEVFKLYTTTTMFGAQEGTSSFADQVDVPRNDGSIVTMDVIRVEDWNYNIQGHYLCWCVAVNER